MSTLIRRNARTATSDKSIWHRLSEDVFREHVIRLEECTNAVPIDPQTFDLIPEQEIDSKGPDRRLLPLAVEQRLAGDLAAIVAVEEGAQSVAAVCLEEHVDHSGLTIRFAAIDTVNSELRTTVQQLLSILQACSKSSVLDEAIYIDEIFNLLVRQHRARILGRLRSRKWLKPAFLVRSHKKPLWQDFKNLIHRAQFVYAKRERHDRQVVEDHLQSLANWYKVFDESAFEDEIDVLRQLVESSYTFCKSPQICSYAHRLQALPNKTPQIASAIKTLCQVEKIAAYKRLSQSLVHYSREYASLFNNIRTDYLPSFLPVETSKGYESWAKVCHVHAEVQLAVHYDVQAPSTVATRYQPRCIGTSKYLCYLCFLFLSHRNRVIQADESLSLLPPFHVTNTHGRLYDQWTIPDLVEFSDPVSKAYTAVISGIDDEICNLTIATQEHIRAAQETLGDGRGNGKKRAKDGGLRMWRVEPMTSREVLIGTDLHPTSSSGS